MIAYSYKIDVYITSSNDNVSTITVEAHDRTRSLSYLVYEASWKTDGSLFGAYRMIDKLSTCEKCEHADIPSDIYTRFVEEMTKLRDSLTIIIGNLKNPP